MDEKDLNTNQDPVNNHIPMPLMEGEEVVEQPNDLEYGYRHKTISTFVVQHGLQTFQFNQHILVIKGENNAQTESLNDQFLAAYRGMELRDRNSIVKLLSVRNEQPVDAETSRAVRGAVGTAHIKAPIAGQNINSQGAKTGLRLTPTGVTR